MVKTKISKRWMEIPSNFEHPDVALRSRDQFRAFKPIAEEWPRLCVVVQTSTSFPGKYVQILLLIRTSADHNWEPSKNLPTELAWHLSEMLLTNVPVDLLPG